MIISLYIGKTKKINYIIGMELKAGQQVRKIPERFL
jgi:hypothetical protein